MGSRDLNRFDVCKVDQRNLPDVRPEITIERFLQASDMAGAYEIPGKVQPCERTLAVLCRIMGGLEIGQVGGESHRFIPLRPVTTPLLAKGPKRCGYRSREVDQQMIFDTLMGPAHLCPREQSQRAPFDFVDAGLETRGHVVIGQGDEIEATEGTSTEHIFGAVPSIRQGRVDVQIDARRGRDRWGERVHYRWWISNRALGLAEASWVPILSSDTPCFAAASTQSWNLASGAGRLATRTLVAGVKSR